MGGGRVNRGFVKRGREGALEAPVLSIPLDIDETGDDDG